MIYVYVFFFFIYVKVIEEKVRIRKEMVVRMKDKIVAIVLAGGKGKRMNSSIQKQYLELNGYPVLYYSLKEIEESQIDEIILAIEKQEVEYVKKEIIEKYGFKKIKTIVEGGKERYESVYNGLQAIHTEGYVLIHDGARPLITQEIIERAIEHVKKYEACVVGMPVKDTIKIVDDRQYVKETPERQYLWLVQTPQIFKISKIKKAYDKMWEIGDNTITDDAMVMEKYGEIPVKLIEGDYQNMKLTTPEDFVIVEALFKLRDRV